MLGALIGRRSFPVGAHCLPAESKMSRRRSADYCARESVSPAGRPPVSVCHPPTRLFIMHGPTGAYQ